MRIFLIGMPGCGKSTIGKKVSEKLNLKYIDMDLYIEEKEGLSIPVIFETKGEEYFRMLEGEALKDFSSMEDIIVSTGGGVIKNKNNKALMNGAVIFLNVDLAELDRRCKAQGDTRPLLRTKTVYDLYEERKDLYDYFKDYEFDNNDIDTTVNNIVKKVR